MDLNPSEAVTLPRTHHEQNCSCKILHTMENSRRKKNLVDSWKMYTWNSKRYLSRPQSTFQKHQRPRTNTPNLTIHELV